MQGEEEYLPSSLLPNRSYERRLLKALRLKFLEHRVRLLRLPSNVRLWRSTVAALVLVSKATVHLTIRRRTLNRPVLDSPQGHRSLSKGKTEILARKPYKGPGLTLTA